MLYPAIATVAARSSVIRLLPQVRLTNPTPYAKGPVGAPPRVDFLLLGPTKSEPKKLIAVPVELKLEKRSSKPVEATQPQLLAEATMDLPAYVENAKSAEACLLVLVFRLPKSAAPILASRASAERVTSRIPKLIRREKPIAQATLCGETCSTIAMAFWLSRALLERAPDRVQEGQ